MRYYGFKVALLSFILSNWARYFIVLRYSVVPYITWLIRHHLWAVKIYIILWTSNSTFIDPSWCWLKTFLDLFRLRKWLVWDFLSVFSFWAASSQSEAVFLNRKLDPIVQLSLLRIKGPKMSFLLVRGGGGCCPCTRTRALKRPSDWTHFKLFRKISICSSFWTFLQLYVVDNFFRMENWIWRKIWTIIALQIEMAFAAVFCNKIIMMLLIFYFLFLTENVP